MSRTIAGSIGAIFVCTLLLSGCTPMSAIIGAEAPESDGTASAAPVQSPKITPTESATAEAPAPLAPPVQAESCDWGASRLDSGGVGAVPDTSSGDLASALIGSWQHTHIDSGAGFEALAPTTDIRFVFPSSDRLLYCQDVEGATNQAENAVDISLSGNDIVLPSPASGYTATTWSADTMVWINNRDGSLYLLKRR